MNKTSELLNVQSNIEKANRTDGRVQNLASHITIEALRSIHETMENEMGYGTSALGKDAYEKNLQENLENLVGRMKRSCYIPNSFDGRKGKRENAGVVEFSDYEDKLVEIAIVQMLEQIYKTKLSKNPEGSVYKFDFENIKPVVFLEMLGEDIADKKFLNLIHLFLKAGVMKRQQIYIGDSSQVQEKNMSQILANIYIWKSNAVIMTNHLEEN